MIGLHYHNYWKKGNSTMATQPMENNLYLLYHSLSSIAEIEYVNDPESGFSYIKHPGFEWPNISFIGCEQQNKPVNISLLLEKVRQHTFPRQFVFSEERLADDSFKRDLIDNRFIFAGQWLNMQLDLEQFIYFPTVRNRLEELKDTTQIPDWTQVVSTCLFNGKELDSSIFTDGMSKGLFRLFANQVDGRIVSTVLAYCNNGEPGIYMVGTLPENRKKGYGYDLVCFALQELKKSGFKTAVLQATKEAIPLYEKIGFVQEGGLFFYYCMSK